jgi:hypothetical protein
MSALKTYFYQGTCYWLFWLSIISSLAVAVLALIKLPDSGMFMGLIRRLFASSMVAGMAFLLLYRGLALSLVSIYERRRAVVFSKPRTVVGFILSLCAPTVFVLIGLLVFIYQLTTGRVHDNF